MRCDDVIHELAAPTGDRQTTAVAEHLADCPACAGWARRAAQLDQLWEATRPLEPSPQAWGSVWANITQSLDSSVPTAIEIESPAHSQPSRNGTSSRSTILAHPAPVPRPARSRTWRPATIALVGLAQAAAIAIAVGLAWQGHTPSRKGQIPPIAQANNPTPAPVPSVIQVAFPVKLDLDIEAGHLVVIRVEGTATQVVDVAPEVGKFTWRIVCRPSISPESMFYAVKVGRPVDQWEDAWYAMFNAVESLDHDMVAAR